MPRFGAFPNLHNFLYLGGCGQNLGLFRAPEGAKYVFKRTTGNSIEIV